MFLKKPNLFLSILRVACNVAVFSALIWNGIQIPSVAACSKAGAGALKFPSDLFMRK